MTVKIGAILQRKGGEVVTIASDATVEAATHLLQQHNIGALVVTSDGEQVEGIISERDIVRQLADIGAECLSRSVRDVMSTDVETCQRHATADDLMITMTRRRIRHVPVFEEGRLVGIVSIGDVVKSRLDELELKTDALEDYVTGSGY